MNASTTTIAMGRWQIFASLVVVLATASIDRVQQTAVCGTDES